ncbi:MAG: hypothetical protein AMJ81_08830 [Phycisphaerae bacterium SM23_33]|nr:MAG: hypothetical protein AMJ81_08830 [Phycisphaerae bacterium SM23_33]
MKPHCHARLCVRFVCLAAAALAPAGAAARAGQARDLKAFFRSGQTFITWSESDAARYHVYRSDRKITDLPTARRIATVARGSSTYPLEAQRKVAARITKKDGYNARYVIQDNPTADPARMLPADTGLWVHTAREAGTFYYAVTAVGPDGAEDISLSDANRLTRGVAEKPQPIGAVLLYQWEHKDKDGQPAGQGRLYCHWMDAADWNPGPTGGYAFNFGVGVPAGKKAQGICMFLHGFSGYYGWHAPPYGMVSIVPGDPHQTWFYGHKDAAGKKVVNYTERRMLLTIDFVVRQLTAEGIQVDTNKIYTHGGSMGGTGGNFLGARYGSVFAAVLASKGAADHNRNGNWTADAERRLWGTRSQKLPTEAGVNVWEHQNLIKWHLAHVGVETAFILDAHASNDGSVPFTAIPEYYEALQKAKRPFAAVWAPWGHGGFEDPHWPNHQWWGTFQFNKDESVPAIGYATSSDPPTPGGRGEINTHIEWSSRENDFDKTTTRDDIVDSPDRWEICLRSCNFHRTQSRQKDVDRQTASITPRRCQKFKAAPGRKFHWENWSCADPAEPVKIAEGTVAADEHGLVTVEKFQINRAGWGNRLVIYPEK